MEGASAEVDSPKRFLSIAILGEHASGKSTLTGHLLTLLSPKIKIKTVFENHFEERIKYSSMVTNRNEKRIGMSVDFHKEFVHTKNTVYQFTDCPGFPLYLNNLIKGMHGSKIAVFVVDVNGACLEQSLQYFRDQLQATRAFGVNKLIFCVNKMDRKTVQWKQQYYEEICAGIKQLLDKMSIKKEYIKGIIFLQSISDEICLQKYRSNFYTNV